jgi:hypothetical protein
VARLVLTDASPLIGLAIVQGLQWLQPLFGEGWLPTQVRDEVLSGLERCRAVPPRFEPPSPPTG